MAGAFDSSHKQARLSGSLLTAEIIFAAQFPHHLCCMRSPRQPGVRRAMQQPSPHLHGASNGNNFKLSSGVGERKNGHVSRALDGLRDLLLFLGGKTKSLATLDLAVVGH